MGSILTIHAQSSGDGYNPENPTEPGDPAKIMKYKVSVVANYDGAGTLSGGGAYKYGTSTTVKATAKTGYKFLYWLKDGDTEAYKTSSSFNHTVEEDVTFTAVFEKAKTVTVKINDSAAGTVSGSTSSIYKGGSTTISTTAKTNYVFQYWLKDEETEPYSTDASFTYTAEDNDVTFTAVYEYVAPPYNPENPGEPTTEADKMVKYKINVKLSENGAGSISGGGKYEYGKSVTISTSPNAGYEFVKWLKDEEFYSDATSFNYTMTTEDVTFTAVYEYVGIPEPVDNSHKLTIIAYPEGSATFDVASGTHYEADETYSVTVTPGTDHEFAGWYINGTEVGTTLTYNSLMSNDDIVLTAKLNYIPLNPDEPTGSFDQGTLVGDIDKSGTVNVSDAVDLISHYLNNTTGELKTSVADVDNNKVINVSDAIEIIQIYLNNK